MNREQMIAHFTIGGWTALKHEGQYVVLFRGLESCVYILRKNVVMYHASSRWNAKEYRKYVCPMERLTTQHLTRLLEAERSIRL